MLAVPAQPDLLVSVGETSRDAVVWDGLRASLADNSVCNSNVDDGNRARVGVFRNRAAGIGGYIRRRRRSIRLRGIADAIGVGNVTDRWVPGEDVHD
jgi:hypothetical protein